MKRKFTKDLLGIIVFSIGFIFQMNPISANAQNCPAPNSIYASSVSNFTATLNWGADSSVSHYRIRYSELGAANWIFEHNVSSTFLDIESLNANETYIWQVKAFCSSINSSSSWSALDTFVTTNAPVDCNNIPNGAAFQDSCGNCVGGTTGASPCIPFSPSATISLSTLECNVISHFTLTTSQDPNEPDIASVIFTSDGGYFDFSGLVTNDTVGSSIISAGGGTINANTILLVDFVITSNKISVKAVDSLGSSYGSFTLENSGTGILIVATSLADNNNVTSGNSQIISLNNLFVNPPPSVITFTSTINSELGHIDIQTATSTIDCIDCYGDVGGTAFIDSCGNCVGGNTGASACIPFSPMVSVSLSNTNCDSLSDLTINVSQDPNEPDMSTSLFSSDTGSFVISSLSIGDTVGVANMSVIGFPSFNTILTVSSIISLNQAVIQSIDTSTGLTLGTFSISNVGGGVSVLAQSVPDNNNVTSGNSQVITFFNLFSNPGQSTLTFTATINSEIGDTDIQNFSFSIVCLQTCPQLGDANCDGIVNLADLTLVINHWLQTTSVGQDGDVVGSLDGFVNLNDLTLVINNWLQSTP